MYELSNYFKELNSPTAYTIKSSDGIKLFIDSFETKKEKTAQNKDRVLFILHGFGEHGARYRHLAYYLGDYFERFYTFDIRGHGRSGGTRGHTTGFDILLEDVLAGVKDVEKKESGKKLTFFCHSFGGLLGTALLLREKKLPFDCAIVSSPLLEVAMPIPSVLKAIAGFLNKTLSGIQLWSDINPQNLSHDPKSTENYVKDSLVHSKVTPKMFFSMQEGMARVRTSTGPLAVPTLFVVPGEDRIVSTPTTKEFFKNLKSDSKKIIEYPGMFHELVNELEREKVFNDIIAYLKEIRR